MKNNTELTTCEQVAASVPAWLTIERDCGYGSVPGLADEELADPEEMERWAFQRDWEPILMLPSKSYWDGPRPSFSEDGSLDWGAFGTMDYARLKPRFDANRQRTRELREKLTDATNMLTMVAERVTDPRRSELMSYVTRGIIGLDDIRDENMRALAKWNLRVRELRRGLKALVERQRYPRPVATS